MVRTADGWRFQERRVSFFFWSSLEEGWDAARFSWPPSMEAADPRTLERQGDESGAAERESSGSLQ
jgi:hypothetical protein